VLELEGETMEKQLAIDVPPSDNTVRRRHLKYFRELIDALCCLHRKGVHCDIKPANILLKRSGSGEGYVFIDFGVSVTRKSSIPHDKSFNEYSSPDNKTDTKSDVWSLACVFLELLIWVYLGGKAAVDEFRADKKLEREKYLPQCHADKTEYFYICEHEAGCVRLNPAVEKWLNKIGYVCRPVVHVLQRMLNIDTEKRSTAEKALMQFLECIES
jgi:serine/threonine protein kinase